jgi:hypothetical protein
MTIKEFNQLLSNALPSSMSTSNNFEEAMEKEKLLQDELRHKLKQLYANNNFQSQRFQSKVELDLSNGLQSLRHASHALKEKKLQLQSRDSEEKKGDAVSTVIDVRSCELLPSIEIILMEQPYNPGKLTPTKAATTSETGVFSRYNPFSNW